MLRPRVGRAGSTLEAKIAELGGTFDAFGVSDAINFVHGSFADLVAATNRATSGCCFSTPAAGSRREMEGVAAVLTQATRTNFVLFRFTITSTLLHSCH